MNYPRTEYEMTQADYDKIIEACQPVPLIMLNIGMPSSPQENANRAWAELGGRMGFDSMTVQPSDKGKLFFTAVPSETPLQREARINAEELAKTQKEIAELKERISKDQSRLLELGALSNALT